MQSMMANHIVITHATLHYSGLKDLVVGELKATHLPSRTSQFRPLHQMDYKTTQHPTTYPIRCFTKTNIQTFWGFAILDYFLY
ncbi:hypothetical protein UPYG_G00231880 [Umbra pygmaea]|uniref:Uncharacterized protein n=1 Tax=Umbra pygmaea TaxID=75934 RepID=A0ABD0X1G4_UMBPY